ncbi:hypothetical protein ABH942_003310 [Flavobacterium sp. 28YEA47A]|uniref:hypothetical protein n=1 Tax=Flavobacterium sp. 28YEA47A TaxID=3156276 RepID=UPI0035163F10
MKSQSNPRSEIRQFYQDTKDEFNAKQPTVRLLERLADKAINLAEKWQGESNEDTTGLYFIIHKMKNFRSDVSGELQHDYDSETKRYRGLWKTQEGLSKDW